ncbi:MAG: peptide-methionine (S)-S-oxide reductase MsrA [Simkaniaceae bacterium]
MEKKEKATFAAGCFWGVQKAFDEKRGVLKTTVGYTGGNVKDPSYEEVCLGKTGHSEAVEIEFNPMQVSYKELLDIFWSIHDPSKKKKQQYKSAIFFHNEEQKEEALQSKQALEKCGRKIETEVLPASNFYPAESYHQYYYKKN